MKRIIKSVALVCLFVVIISGVYFVYTIRSSGTSHIHYIEPEDQSVPAGSTPSPGTTR